MFKRIPWKKYNAVRVEIDWIKFRSKLESICYIYLKENFNIIEYEPAFILQWKFEYEWKKYREIKYKSDFLLQMKGYKLIIEIKGFETPEWKLKKKMFLNKMAIFEKEYDCKLKFIVAKSRKDMILQLEKIKSII